MAKKEEVNEINRIPFSLEVLGGILEIRVAGDIDAGVLQGKSLSADNIKSFLTNSVECQEYMKVYSLVSLMKIREMILVFLRTVFDTYRVDVLRVKWTNGPDSFSIG